MYVNLKQNKTPSCMSGSTASAKWRTRTIEVGQEELGLTSHLVIHKHDGSS